MKQIVLKWYQKLNFPQEYDKPFMDLLDSYSKFDWTDINAYDPHAHTAQENLLAYLYFCEALEKQYEQKGIDEGILLHTLSDIVLWTKVWFSMKKEIGLAEPEWVKRSLSFRLFRIGRLQFCFGQFFKDYPNISVKAGENVIEVHIPADGRLSFEECTGSFEDANEFFEKYFPNFEYRFYSCDSWLLDDSLKTILGENSNICRFGARFLKIDKHESDLILRYVFRWGTTREKVAQLSADTALAKALKLAVEKNERFYEVLGVIAK